MTINSTKNYDMFKKIEGNRDICQENINRIMNSMKIKNLLKIRPILVNSDFGVIDGQHRLECAKQLDIPVYYQIEESLEDKDIILLNNQKRWSLVDYVNYKAAKGCVSSKLILEACKKTNIGISGIHKALKRQGGTNKNSIKSDKMVPIEKELIYNLISKTDKANEILEMIRLKGNYPAKGSCIDTDGFRGAMYRMLLTEGVDEQRLMDKLELRLLTIRKGGGFEGYLSTFREAYNFKTSNKIDFEATSS